MCKSLKTIVRHMFSYCNIKNEKVQIWIKVTCRCAWDDNSSVSIKVYIFWTISFCKNRLNWNNSYGLKILDGGRWFWLLNEHWMHSKCFISLLASIFYFSQNGFILSPKGFVRRWRYLILNLLQLRTVVERFDIDFRKDAQMITKLRLTTIKAIRGYKTNCKTIPLLNLLINSLTV